MRWNPSLLAVLLAVLVIPTTVLSQDSEPNQITYNDQTHPLFPEAMAEPPDVPSPLLMEDGTEIVTCFTRDDRYFLIPVTAENGDPLDYQNDQWWGKGRQLDVARSKGQRSLRSVLHQRSQLHAHSDAVDRWG